MPLFLGHGIGRFLHGPPDIYHVLNNYPRQMVPGMVFTIEPVIRSVQYSTVQCSTVQYSTVQYRWCDPLLCPMFPS